MQGNINILIIFVSAILFHGCMKPAHTTHIHSPDQKLSVQLGHKAGKIIYAVFWHDNLLIDSSELSIFPGSAARITGSHQRSENKKWKPTWGQFSEIEDNYNELVLDIEYPEAKTRLYVRLYDQGVGFRYEIEEYDEGIQATLYCQYKLSREHAIYSPGGERAPFGPIRIEALSRLEERPKLKIPIVAEKSETPYLSFLESDLFSAPGFEVMKLGYDNNLQSLRSSNETLLSGSKTITPWRVILINEKIGDLVTNTVPLNLAAPLQLADPSWIKPGKTLWDWRVHGYTTADGFTYGINTESYKRFIDFAAENGIEYFLIDDAWYTHVSSGHFELSDKLDLQAVIDYAAEKKVDLLLYYDRRHGEYGDEALFPYYQSLGMKGIKYGFMGSDVPFTRQAIQQSAASQLLIDFHDGPVPMTGIERTLPNAVTKEYCHAQQDSRRAFTPETFIKMALINAIQGPPGYE